ncbi:putative sulfate exporter family transporter [Entomospira entomophila]|uniref:Sulfate exporter family transporter n=1 Tax=Entomospira entomophila TaxID=2719988 RepID=A0A968KWN9_9SPIO|nr:putative sulfate exporter family transporter [Entomospira entomophilus]NIZ40995.1 putative sulfate exporter family transporter [Entomospira entomophilus]WDI35208.1 putative sulfate exporter family transporter [Entomospira entomophilus]
MKSVIYISAGILLSIIVALISFALTTILPALGSATIAIFLGIIIRNTVATQSIFTHGTKIVEGKFLEIAVMLLGANVTLYTIQQLGRNGLLFIVVLMSATIYVYMFLGKLLRIPPSVRLLMAGGNAVCGSSAIASIVPVINAKEEDKGQVITIVNLMGTGWMLLLPLIAQFLYPDQPIHMAGLIGGTLPSVGQVTAASHLINSTLVHDAMLFKIVRISLLAIVVLAMRVYHQRSHQIDGDAVSKKPLHSILPWYIIAFLLLSITNTMQLIPPSIQYSFSSLQNWLEVTALAAIGLRLDLRKFMQSGSTLLRYAIMASFIQVLLAIMILHVMIK